MTIDEIAILEGDMCILQLRGVRPFLSKKYDITKHPLYRHLSDFDKRNRFDVERYLSTDLRLKPSDMFVVYNVELQDAPSEAFDDMPTSDGV